MSGNIAEKKYFRAEHDELDVLLCGNDCILMDTLESFSAAVVVVDRSAVIRYVNSSCTELLGRSAEVMLGLNLREYEPTASICKVLDSGEALKGDVSHIFSSPKDVAADIIPLRAGGKLVGAVGIMMDITALEQAAGALEHYKRMNETLRNEIAGKDKLPPAFKSLIGQNSSFLDVLRVAALAAPTSTNICITGESGVGKNFLRRRYTTAATVPRALS